MATPYSLPSLPERTPLHERAIVVGLVFLLHLAVFAAYRMRPESPAVLVNEMSVSFASIQMRQANVSPRPKSRPREPKPEPVPSPQPEVHDDAQPVPQRTAPSSPAQQAATPPSPVVLDTDPDYRADYLNNPRPPYPLMARRMGYHGKVVLDVEVLAEGTAGEVKLHQSSGYDILDNAALQTVRTWHFTPARHLGRPVTQRFLVPIKFSLEDNAG